MLNLSVDDPPNAGWMEFPRQSVWYDLRGFYVSSVAKTHFPAIFCDTQIEHAEKSEIKIW
jgi:hypothetical protein